MILASATSRKARSPAVRPSCVPTAVGLILGLAAVGYVQAAYTLMGPLMIMMFGTGAVIVPELARVLRRSPRHLPMVCLGYGGCIRCGRSGRGASCCSWYYPEGSGIFCWERSGGPRYPLVPLVTLAFMGGCIQAGAGGGLRALGAAQRSLRAMILSSIVVCCLLPCRRTRRRNDRDRWSVQRPRPWIWCDPCCRWLASPRGAARARREVPDAGPDVVRQRSRRLQEQAS